MQYIEKTQFEPEQWGDWFTTGDRLAKTEARVKRYNDATEVKNAGEFLLTEQYGLCAYCQRERDKSESSIEHVTPNNSNLNLSTHYHNLVAACRDSKKDADGRRHCNAERKNKLLAPLIFYKEAQVTLGSTHGFFDAKRNGMISPCISDSDNPIHKQVAAFIEILNLNHSDLVQRRKDAWQVLENNAIGTDDTYWPTEFTRLLEDTAQPFRQFLLILVKKKL